MLFEWVLNFYFLVLTNKKDNVCEVNGLDKDVWVPKYFLYIILS